MDNFERMFLKLYPKNVSQRIKLITMVQSHIDKLEKNEIATGIPSVDKTKWEKVAMLLDQKRPIEEIDSVVLSGILGK